MLSPKGYWFFFCMLFIIFPIHSSAPETNYANKDQGAKIVAISPKIEGAANILNNNKDYYLRVPCATEPKYFIVQLSEEIIPNRIELANYELFSGQIKNFSVSVSRTLLSYDDPSWKSIGNYTASFTRNKQSFHLPLATRSFAKYLKIGWIDSFTSEKMCTLSSFAVYGTSALESLEAQLRENELLHTPEIPNIAIKNTHYNSIFPTDFPANVNNTSVLEVLGTRLTTTEKALKSLDSQIIASLDDIQSQVSDFIDALKYFSFERKELYTYVKFLAQTLDQTSDNVNAQKIAIADMKTQIQALKFIITVIGLPIIVGFGLWIWISAASIKVDRNRDFRNYPPTPNLRQ